MGQQCFVCQNKMGWGSVGYTGASFERQGLEIPEGIKEYDKICNSCFNQAESVKKNRESLEKKQNKESSKQLQKESSTERKQIMDDIISRVPEYKARWDKGGVIQYKDEYCAILRRVWGQQVEFIIAYSDLTKEGYRLMAQDEGKSGSSGGLTGGVDSYYYFQKISFVR